jgi:hypothetical protein
MGKVIFWIIVVFVALLGLRLLNAGQAKRRQGEARAAESGTKSNEMVRCVRCGLFLPRAEATPAPGGFACADGRCAEHR